MKFKIFKMEQPHAIRHIDNSGYHPQTISPYVLEELNLPYGFEDEHDSMELALTHIQENGEKIKYLTLTIVPVIEIDYEGKIR